MASYQDRELAKLKILKADKGFFGRFVKKLTKRNEAESTVETNGAGVQGLEDQVSLGNGINGVVTSKAWGGLGLLCERMQGMTLNNLETVFAEVKG